MGIANPKTEVITDGVARFTNTGIVAADGTERDVDVVVCATGFHVTDSYTYVNIKGRAGEDLVDRWNHEGIAALRGITIADMPNLFFLLGPNTALGHNSVVFMIESQIRYAAHAIAAVDKKGAQALAPTRSAQDTYNKQLQDDLAGTVWSAGRCGNWLHGCARGEPDAVERNDVAILAGHPQVQRGRVCIPRRAARRCLVCAEIANPPDSGGFRDLVAHRSVPLRHAESIMMHFIDAMMTTCAPP